MAAAVTLADVVEQEAQVQHRRVLDLGEDLAEPLERGVAGARPGNTVEGLDRSQGVLVDRVAVVEVVLDEERHAGELGKQAAEQTRLVHGPQRRPDAPLVPEQVHERPAGLARRAERAIHEGKALVDVELQLLAQVRTLALRDGESLEQAARAAQGSRGPAREQLAVADLEGAAGPPAQEAEPEAPPRGGGSVAEQEAPREPVELRGALVVVAHQDLRGEHAPARAIAEVGGQRRLKVEREQVRLAARREMGLVADTVELVVGAQR